MQPAVLLCLLGAVALAAVSSVPVDSKNHNEEMVTRCIIEVLSNALSKSSVPTITPECRQVLNKSGKEVKGEEKSENENKKFEVRLLRDPADASIAHWPSSREESRTSGEATRGQTKADTEKWTEGGSHSPGGAEEPQERLQPSSKQGSEEAKTVHPERNEGGEREVKGENYPQAAHKDSAGEEKHLEEPGEKQNAFPSKRNQAAAKKGQSVARASTQSAGLSEEEEETHSREHSSQESREESRSQEKHPVDLSNYALSQEESEESEEEDAASQVAKRTRPRHHHGRNGLDRSSQEWHPPTEGRGFALEGSPEADVGVASLGEKRGHHPTHYEAFEEAPDYGDLEGPQIGGGRSEEDWTPWQSQEEYKRNRPSSGPENIVNRYEEERVGEGVKGRPHRGKGGELTDSREDRRLLGEGHYRVHESQTDQAEGHPQTKWQQRNYLSYGEERARGKWPGLQDHLLDPDDREEARLQDKQYVPYRTTEKRKRLGVLFNPYFDPLQWKNSDFEKKDGMDDNFLEGEDENGLTLAEKNFFPEYNYDLWEKRPFSEDVNWGFEKRSFAKPPQLDLKQQYDGVAGLDQLLHYRKKSAEFPDFYDSEEQMGPRPEAENGQDRAQQRVLTKEEEKEFENLAAMDLELQKIADKFGQMG